MQEFSCSKKRNEREKNTMNERFATRKIFVMKTHIKKRRIVADGCLPIQFSLVSKQRIRRGRFLAISYGIKRMMLKTSGILLAIMMLVNIVQPLTLTAEPTFSKNQDVSHILAEKLHQLSENIPEPAFGTEAGEWSVLCLARGECFNKNHSYFSDYYKRIVEYVNTRAAEINMNGALHKSKSTDNSRLILALSSIGKTATSVGNWNLIQPYNDFDWIKKQGINGVIFTLIALDSHQYETDDPTIRRQCLNYLLEKELPNGGWLLSETAMDADTTAMALQAMSKYMENADVAAAAQRAFKRLSEEQLPTGGFLCKNDETCESVAQVIVACVAWGINPDTDHRFIKNGNSAIDNILTYYVAEESMFKHIHMGNSNGMATDQACYALIAYDRMVNGKSFLYDCSDVIFTEGRTFSAGVLYEGEGISPISADKKAIVVTITALESVKSLTYNDGTNIIVFKYNAEISSKLGKIDSSVIKILVGIESLFCISAHSANAIKYNGVSIFHFRIKLGPLGSINLGSCKCFLNYYYCRICFFDISNLSFDTLLLLADSAIAIYAHIKFSF